MELYDLAKEVISLATKQGQTIRTAESCTGGLLSAWLTEIDGASLAFQGGLVTYSNNDKEKFLDISPDLLKKHGAVSKQVACAMAKHNLHDANISIAITGIAGPSSDGNKTVGLVFIALATTKNINHITCKQHNFSGNRANIRLASVTAALQLALESLQSPII